MGRRITKIIAGFLLLAAAGFFLLAPALVERGQNRVLPHAPWPVSAAAIALHDRLLIGDLHADPLLWGRDLTLRANRGQMDLPRLQAGNVALQVFTTVTKSPSGLNYDRNSANARDDITLLSFAQLRPPKSWFNLTERALTQAAALAQAEAEAPAMLKIIRNRTDLASLLAARAQGAKTVGGILGAEGGHALSGDLANLDRLYDAGFRLIGLTHFFDNELGASLHGEAGAETGLTDFGRAVVRRMGEKHMIIDLAHAAPQLVREVVGMVDVPVVVSHTGIYSQCPHHRNIPDDLIRAVADKGGLIGIGFWEEVTCDTSPAGIAKSIQAAVQLVGPDHVALGSDFDGSVTTSFDASELAALTQALMDAGLDEPTITKVMGGNMARFLAQALPPG
ncbi:MAG: membrane dipeptidase [Rhodobacteraceae bacterium]|nr:membrane dipeptidase [Paracoccaceae bacterium]